MSNESIEYSKYRLMRAKEDLESSISSLEIVGKEQAEIQISQAKKFIEVIDKHLDNINN